MKKNLIITGLFIMASCSKNPSDSNIKQIAKEFIKQDILTPSTVKFPSDGEIKVERQKGDSMFYISSYVDAQNAFGAMIRNDWKIHVWYIGGDFSDIKSYKLLHE